MRKMLRAAAVGAACTTLSLTSAVAQATPGGPGVTGKVLVHRTIGNRDYILRQVTIPPGQGTGWHYHGGTLYAYVKQGTLSHCDATCASDGVYDQGSSLEEPSGANHVHLGQNRGTTDVVLEVLYVL
ncbi:MAG: cupin domain-containing protein, partial [Streptomyces sp.]|uniref:cupin domain-containing protein n=1 Tax=Streptomyces sp. TaxID=1931 RepID=UPI0025D8638E